MKDIYYNMQSDKLPSKGKYKAEVISKGLSHRVGVDHFGFLCLFIKTNCKQKDTRPSISTKYITVHFNAPCEINSNHEKNVENFSVIILKTRLNNLIDYFINIFSDFIYQKGSTISLEFLYQTITSLFSLFSKKQDISKRVIQGLFAEMAFIYCSDNKETLISAWHKEKSAICDFNLEDFIIEVKSTTKSERIHRFSNSQIGALRSNDSIVVSIFILESDLGISILDLANRLRDRATEFKTREKIDKIIFQTIGSNWDKLEQLKFDLNYSANSLQYYKANLLPYLNPSDVPSSITKIKYDLNFSKIKTIKFTLR